jgi:Holliday junction resolvasome RuvABC endonuclease subunit
MTEGYLGIDPGLAGGFVLLSGDKIVCKMVMPTISFKTVDGKTKTEIDREGVLSFLCNIPPLTHVAIEEVQAYRKQNITATCTTCRNYGMLLMSLTFTHMFITEVPSDVWQKHFGIFPAKKTGGKSTKQQAFDSVHMIYPNEDFRKSNRSHSFHTGIVDATLIAKYCQLLFAPFHEPSTGVQLVSAADETPLECKPGGNQHGTKIEWRLF